MQKSLCILISMLYLSACGIGGEQPLDADTKRTIDSISVIRIRETRNELDTLLKQQRVSLMPLLVDSIKKERQKEIDAALKNVPK